MDVHTLARSPPPFSLCPTFVLNYLVKHGDGILFIRSPNLKRRVSKGELLGGYNTILFTYAIFKNVISGRIRPKIMQKHWIM